MASKSDAIFLPRLFIYNDLAPARFQSNEFDMRISGPVI